MTQQQLDIDWIDAVLTNCFLRIFAVYAGEYLINYFKLNGIVDTRNDGIHECFYKKFFIAASGSKFKHFANFLRY